MALERVVPELFRSLSMSATHGHRKLGVLRRVLLSSLLNSPNPEEFLSRITMELGTGMELPVGARPKLLAVASAVRGAKLPAKQWAEVYAESPEVLGAAATGHLPVIPFRLSEIIARVGPEGKAFLGQAGERKAIRLLSEEPIDEVFSEVGKDVLKFLRESGNRLIGAAELKAAAREALQRRELPVEAVLVPSERPVLRPTFPRGMPLHTEYPRGTREVMSWFSRIIGEVRQQSPEDVLREAYIVGEASAAMFLRLPSLRQGISAAVKEARGEELSKAMFRGIVFGEKALSVARGLTEFGELSPASQVRLVRNLSAMEYLGREMSDLGITGAAIGIKNARYWSAFRSIVDLTSTMDYLAEYPEREIVEQALPVVFKRAEDGSLVEVGEFIASKGAHVVFPRGLEVPVHKVPSVLRPSVEKALPPSEAINLQGVLYEVLRRIQNRPEEAAALGRAVRESMENQDISRVVSALASLSDEFVSTLPEEVQRSIAAFRTAEKVGEAAYRAYWGESEVGRRRLLETFKESEERHAQKPLRKWRTVLGYLGDLPEEDKSLVFALDAGPIWKLARNPEGLADVLRTVVTYVNRRTGDPEMSMAVLRKTNEALKKVKALDLHELEALLMKAINIELGRRGL